MKCIHSSHRWFIRWPDPPNSSGRIHLGKNSTKLSLYELPWKWICWTHSITNIIHVYTLFLQITKSWFHLFHLGLKFLFNGPTVATWWFRFKFRFKSVIMPPLSIKICFNLSVGNSKIHQRWEVNTLITWYSSNKKAEAILTLFLIFSGRNGWIMANTGRKNLGSLMKWIPRTFNGNESC